MDALLQDVPATAARHCLTEHPLHRNALQSRPPASHAARHVRDLLELVESTWALSQLSGFVFERQDGVSSGYSCVRNLRDESVQAHET